MNPTNNSNAAGGSNSVDGEWASNYYFTPEQYDKLYRSIIARLNEELSLERTPFIFFTVLSDLQDAQLIYTALDEMKKQVRKKNGSLATVNKYFNQLLDHPIKLNLGEGKVSSVYYPFSRRGYSSRYILDNAVGALSGYFHDLSSPRKLAEKEILKAAKIDIEDSHYMSLPMYRLNSKKLFGIAHFVIFSKDLSRFVNPIIQIDHIQQFLTEEIKSITN